MTTDSMTEDDEDYMTHDPIEIRMVCLAHAVTAVSGTPGGAKGVVEAAKAFETYIMGEGVIA